jgi:hypothetical protein
MPNFSATADLHQTLMTTPIYGQKNRPGPRWLESGKVSDLINRVLEKREPDQALHSITVPLEAGFGKDVLHFRDIQDFGKHPDFPK